MSRALVSIVLLLLSLAPALSTYSVHPVGAQSPTFTMTATPSSLSFPTGSFETSNITIASQNGFTGTIGLSGESFPYQQVSVTLYPTVVNLPAYGVVHAVVNVSSTSTVTPYNYTIDVNGFGLGGSQTAFLSALVTPGPATVPDFRLSANPDLLSVAPGSVQTSTISVASLDGFVSEVSLTVFFFPNHLNASLVHVSAGSVVNLTLTIPAGCPGWPSNTPGHITVDANSTSLHHWLDVYVLVTSPAPSFCFRADTSLVVAVAGSYAETQFTMLGLDGFNDAVALSAWSSFPVVTIPESPGLVTILPGSISGLAQENPQLFNILVNVPPSTPPGNYTVTVTGTGGAFSWSDNVTVMTNVGPYYNLSVNPGSLTVPEGSTGTATISLTGENGFNRNDVGAYGPVSYPSGLSGNVTAPPNTVTPYGFFVDTGYTTIPRVIINASLAVPGNYILIFGVSQVYSPYVTSYAIFSVTV